MKISPAVASWLQVGPLAIVLAVFFGLPVLVVVAASFFDYDHMAIVPTFILDNYQDLFTDTTTLELYLSSIKFAVITWAITLGDRFLRRLFPGVSYPESADQDRPVSAVLGAVLDLEHHPHDLVDSLSWAATASSTRC